MAIHNLSARKSGFVLRPVVLEDAAEIVRLRNSPHALNFIGDSAKTVADQEKWLQQAFARPSDYNFMIETAARPRSVGVLGIYGIQGEEGEWGRWVIEPGVMAAPASAWMVLHLCFEALGLQKVRGLLVESNKEVISFHRRIGYAEIGYHAETRSIGGKDVRMIEFITTRSDWPRVGSKLEQFAKMAESLNEKNL